MTTFKLVPYTFKIYEKGKKSNQLPLEKPIGKHKNFSEFLVTKLTKHKDDDNEFILKGSKKSISIESVFRSVDIISGITDYGEFGIEASFTDVNTGIEVIGTKRKENYSEKYPYYYLFFIPKKGYQGIIILEKYKNIGIKTTLEKLLNNFLDTTYFNIELTPLISRDLLDQIDKSRLVEFNMKRLNISTDIAEKFSDDSENNRNKTSEIHEIHSIVANRNREIKLSQRIKDPLSEEHIEYYEIDSEKYNEIKAVIEIGKMRKTLTFGNGKNKYSESLELESIPLKGGFPVYVDLNANAKDYLKYLAEKTGIN